MATYNDWAFVLGPCATLMVGIGVIGIAFMQWILARRKLRLDLFDRRYKVYSGTREFLLVVLAKVRFSDDELRTFYAATSDAEFLFERDVVAYLEEIKRRAIDARKHGILLEPLPVGEERSRHVQAETDHLLWLGGELENLKKPFLPYLGFENVR